MNAPKSALFILPLNAINPRNLHSVIAARTEIFFEATNSFDDLRIVFFNEYPY